MWEEKGYSGGRRANFALESSKVTIQGVMWDRTLSNLRRRGTVPKVGDVVAVSGKVNVRTTSCPPTTAKTHDITTKELSIFEVWPIASATEPEIDEPPAVIDFAAKFKELRASTPDKPKGPPAARTPRRMKRQRLTGPCPDNVVQFPDQGVKPAKKATASWCAIETDEHALGMVGPVIDGDPKVRKTHMNARFPIKNDRTRIHLPGRVRRRRLRHGPGQVTVHERQGHARNSP